MDRIRSRDVMDWAAAIWAGLIAGTLFLLALFAGYWWGAGTPPWLVTRFIAAMILGPSVLQALQSFNLVVFVLGAALHLAFSVLFALLIAFILHRWGILAGIVGGAAIGAALYFINFHVLTNFFPWLNAGQGWPMLWGHVLYGAVAGGLYELLEEDEEEVRVRMADRPPRLSTQTGMSSPPVTEKRPPG